MKYKLTQISLFSLKINRRYLQFFWTLIALALLVLGIGAPAVGGGGSI
jgi:hypothetical protein